METDRNKNLIVYLSPSGNTRKVAEIIVDTLNQIGQKTEVLDLAAKDEKDQKKLAFDTLNHGSCLWVGSPIYANHALPQVIGFLSNLQQVEGICAVPFITYGGVTSGVGLYEMGLILAEKGFKLPGAAKILAAHSMMWMFKNPLGVGRPNEDDKALVRELVKAVNEKISRPGIMKPLTVDSLNYQPKVTQEKFHRADITATKKIFPPMKFDIDLCTKCGVCEENCPTHNISFDPDLKFGDDCILCYNCLRHCEPEAITNDIFDTIEDRLRFLASEYSEKPTSKMLF
jgi:ferredoxin/flavodoxin